jgi:hypothetical protein
MSCCIRLFRWIFKCKRNVENILGLGLYIKVPKSVVLQRDIPWLWLGAETVDGKIHTITDMINNQLDYGDIVNHQYLKSITQLAYVDRWLYLNPVTLKEEEIPPEGLVIENDTDK